MAITKIKAVKSRIDHLVDYVSNNLKTTGIETVVDYATNKSKTHEKEFVTCINCSMFNPTESFINTKKLFKDEKEILAFHAFQSFDGDEVDAEIAHKIGVEFAQEMWGDRFEVVVATHLNTQNIHNHFLINSTSFVDGKRYYNTKKDIHRMRELNDSYCRKYNLSVLDNNQPKEKNNYYQEKPLRDLAREDIDYAISNSRTLQAFEREIVNCGYELARTSDGYKIRHPQSKKFIRLKSLGEKYTLDAISKRIYDNFYVPTIYEKKAYDIKPHCYDYENKKLTGFQRLVMHYQYVFGILPHHKAPKTKHTKEYYRAIKRMDIISNQTIMAFKFNIVTLEDLQNFKSTTAKTMEDKSNERQKLRNKIRRCTNPEVKNQYQLQVKDLNTEIKELRNYLKLSEDLESRSTQIEQDIQKLETEKQQTKEKKQYERY